MKIKNYILEVPVFEDGVDETEIITFDLMIPDEAEAAVNMLIGVTEDLLSELEDCDKENYVKRSN